MKKIIGTILAGAVMSGVAFAADISFSYTGEAYFSTTGADTTQTQHYDDVSLTLKNDIAGATFEVSDHFYNSKVTTKDLDLETYYGWMNFALPVGSLQVSSGKWTSRYMNRVTADVGILDSDTGFYELYKPGVINGKYAADADNLNNGASIATSVAYTVKDLPGTLMVRGLIGNSSSWNGVTGSTTTDDDYVLSNFGGEIAYKQDGLVDVSVAIRSLTNDTMSFGVFVSPLMVEKLTALAGFSYGKDDDNSEYAFDLRARYALNDKIAFTTMNNYSHQDTTVSTTSSKMTGPATNYTYSTTTYYFGETAMWNMLSVSYKGGDNIRFTATCQNIVPDFDALSVNNASNGSNIMGFMPGVEINVSKKATVAAGFSCLWTQVGQNKENLATQIPIIFNFSL